MKNPIILWNIDPNDWKDCDTKIVADRIIAAAKPGAIILSHDIYETTVSAMPRVIKTLTEEGYHFVTVPDLFPNNSLKPGMVYRNL